MKTPKDKAQQLVSRFFNYVLWEDERVSLQSNSLPLPSKKVNAKRCALETVDEITMALVDATGDELGGPHALYWAMVRREIEEL